VKLASALLLSSLFFLSVYSFGDEKVDTCPGKKILTSEKGESLTFCEVGKYLVTSACFEKGADCQLIKDLKKAPPKPVVSSSEIGSPASKKCHALKWKVLMGKMFDGSSVCTCEHPSGDAVICTSLL
jgi:hypothetical protein